MTKTLFFINDTIKKYDFKNENETIVSVFSKKIVLYKEISEVDNTIFVILATDSEMLEENLKPILNLYNDITQPLNVVLVKDIEKVYEIIEKQEIEL